MPPPSSDHRPSEITGRVFAVRRKGFDTDEVRAYLGQLAEIVSRLTVERDEARASVEDLRAAAAARPEIDEDQLTEALGEETARVLSSARKAAADMKEKAEENVARMLREAAEEAGSTRRAAEDDAARLREEAQSVRDAAEEAARRAEAEAEAEAAQRREAAEAELAAGREAIETERADAVAEAETLRAEAEADAARIRAEADEAAASRRADADRAAAESGEAAEADADRIRAAAAEEAESIKSSARTEQEQSRAEGEELVAEARRVRERMLADLARRRKAAKVQLEQLEGARENLIETYEAARRALDEATDGLRTALPRAKSAAETSRLRAESEPADTVEGLESQISAARAAGLPLVAAEHPGTTGGSALWGPPEGESGGTDEKPAASGGAEPSGAETASGTEAPNGVAPSDPNGTEEGVDALFAQLKASRDLDPEEPVAAEGEADGEPADGGDAGESGPGDAGEEPTQPVEVVDAVDAAGGEVSARGEDSVGEEVLDEDTTILDLFERRDGAIEPVESRVARKLKRVLADEQGLVLDGVRRASGTPDLDEILTVDDQVASYASAVSDELLAAAEEGAAFEGAALPTSVAVADLAAELGRTLAGVVRPKVERCFESGEDADDTSDHLRATYREWKTDRLVESTRHLVLAAFGRGQNAVRPGGSQVRWTPDPASPACPDCEDDALAGAVTSGEAFPTGHLHPPAHPGCRCLVVSERITAPA